MGGATWHIPEDTGRGFYLDSWAGRLRVDGNRIVLPLVEWGGRTDSEKGGDSPKYRNIGTGLP